MTLANTQRGFEQIMAMFSSMPETAPVAFDVETNSKDENTAVLVGFSVSDGYESFYVPVAHLQGGNMPDELWYKIMDEVQRRGVIAHNAKYDVIVMERHGWTLPIVADTMLLAYCVHAYYPLFNFGLKFLVKHLFGHEMTNFKDLFPGKRPKDMHFEDLPVEVAASYAAADAYWTMRLYDELKDKLNQNTEQIYKLEMAVLPYVMKMQKYGIPMDVEAMRAEGARLQLEAENARKAFYELVAVELGKSAYELEQRYPINSPKKFAELIYGDRPEGLGLKVFKRTPKGSPSTDKDALKPHAKNPIIATYLAWKAMVTVARNFYIKIAAMVAEDGRLRASINQAGATTGRFGTSNPNIQNFPKKQSWKIYRPDGSYYEVSTNFRNMIAAPDGYQLLQLDYSQVEFRLMAGLVGAKVILDAYRTGADMHVRTYAFCFQVPEDSVTKEQRAIGKTINFALIYGMGPERLERQLGGKFSLDEATKIHRRYFQLVPELTAAHDAMRRETAKTRRVSTYFGREQIIPEFYEDSRIARSKAKRAGFARRVQGSAADIMKMAIVKVGRLLDVKYPDIEMILTLHDALFFLVPDSYDMIMVIKDIRREMELELPGFPPIVTGISLGKKWGEQEEIDVERDEDDIQLTVSAKSNFIGVNVFIDDAVTPSDLRKLKESLSLASSGATRVDISYKNTKKTAFSPLSPVAIKGVVDGIDHVSVSLVENSSEFLV